MAAMAVATVAGIAQGTPDRVLLSKDTLAQVTWLFIIEGVGVVCGVRRVVAG